MNRFEKVYPRYRELSRSLWDAPKEERAEKFLRTDLGDDRSYFSYIASVEHPDHFPQGFDQEVINGDPDELLQIATEWFEFRTGSVRHMQAAHYAWDLDNLTKVKVMLNAMLRAKAESLVFQEVASRIDYQIATPEAIALFRDAWDELAPESQEAIDIAYTGHLARHEYRYAQGKQSVLEKLVRGAACSSSYRVRPRWIDADFEVARQRIWFALSDGFTRYDRSDARLASEPERVGVLLTFASLTALSSHEDSIRDGLRNGEATLTVDYFGFNSKTEEPFCGADFVFLFRHERESHKGRPAIIDRFALFQAKVIENDDAARVDRLQLELLLQSSTQSTYVFLHRGKEPRCVPAMSVRELAERSGSNAKTVRIKWAQLVRYSTTFSDLIGDQFLCCELGDDPRMPSETLEEIAKRIAREFGRPRYGVVCLHLTRNSEQSPDLVINDKRTIEEHSEDA